MKFTPITEDHLAEVLSKPIELARSMYQADRQMVFIPWIETYVVTIDGKETYRGMSSFRAIQAYNGEG